MLREERFLREPRGRFCFQIDFTFPSHTVPLPCLFFLIFLSPSFAKNISTFPIIFHANRRRNWKRHAAKTFDVRERRQLWLESCLGASTRARTVFSFFSNEWKHVQQKNHFRQVDTAQNKTTYSCRFSLRPQCFDRHRAQRHSDGLLVKEECMEYEQVNGSWCCFLLMMLFCVHASPRPGMNCRPCRKFLNIRASSESFYATCR